VFLGFYYQLIFLSIIFLFLIEFFDQLDGVVARLQGSTTFGAFLDSTLDRYGDAFLFLGLYLGEYIGGTLAILIIVGAFFTSYTRARIEGLGISSLGGVGLFERTDRVPILMTGTILKYWIPDSLYWTSIILLIGSHFTAVQRIWFAFTHLSKQPDNLNKSNQSQTDQNNTNMRKNNHADF